MSAAAERERLRRWTWSLEEAGVALEAIGRRLGAESVADELPRVRSDAEHANAALDRFFERAAPAMGLDVSRSICRYGEARSLLLGCGPALLRVDFAAEGGVEPRLLVVLGRRGNGVRVLGPTLREHTVGLERLRVAWTAPMVEAVTPRFDALLDRAKVAPHRRLAALEQLIDARFGNTTLDRAWMVRPLTSGPLRPLLREAGVGRDLAAVLGAQLLRMTLLVAAWALLGGAALDGDANPAVLGGWVLMLVTIVPLQLSAAWFQGRLVIGLGAVIKNRLLEGVLHLDPDLIRDEGSGHLLSRVLESEAVGTLALSAGLTSIVGVIELAFSAMVLGIGAGGLLHVALLLAWVSFSGAWSYRYYRTRRRTTAVRMELTHELVERIVGHRTRLAQLHPHRWHDGEDQALGRYVELCGALDRLALVLGAVVARGWMVVGLLGLLPAVGSDASTASFAVGLGGVFLAQQALSSIIGGLSSLVGAAVAWEQAQPLFAAAARAPRRSSARPEGRPEPGEAIIDAQNLSYRYPGRGRTVLHQSTFVVRRGDRVLLEGPSGGGKSTLAALVTGLRQPDHGLLLARGLDRATLGEDGWRHVVATAPQFHENHVLTGTLGFNLLMGRQWPPTSEQMLEALTVCRELGLGPLLERMPSGLQQLVGESGWQLSHGEKSRLYIARALLQGADVVVLDESFAALDPGTLRQALQCVLERAPTLLVIAHP